MIGIIPILVVVAASSLTPMPLESLTIKHAFLTCGDGKEVTSLLFVRHDRETSYIRVNDARTGKQRFEAPIDAVLKSDDPAQSGMEFRSAKMANGDFATVTVATVEGRSQFSLNVVAKLPLSAKCFAVPSIPRPSK